MLNTEKDHNNQDNLEHHEELVTDLQAKAWTARRMLENQGYQFDVLSNVVLDIAPDQASQLLEILQNLAEDKQESSVIITKNSDLLSKVTSELEMLRKQNVIINKKIILTFSLTFFEQSLQVSLEKELSICKKKIETEKSQQKTKEEQISRFKKQNASTQANLQKQLVSLQKRDVQYKVDCSNI